MNRAKVQHFLWRHTYIFSLLLLVVLLAVNYSLQDNLFELRVLNNSMRTLLPLILLAVGQAIVVIGGGIDLSVGTMVSMLVAMLVNLIDPESTTNEIVLSIPAGAAGSRRAAERVCGRALALVNHQTHDELHILRRAVVASAPRWQIPTDCGAFAQTPYGVPLSFYVIGALLLFWVVLRSTRYAQYLFATGSDSQAAYKTGIPVRLVRMSTYVWAGLFAGLAATALTLSTGSGQANIGDNMTLDSIVAVVLGGTSMSGGKGGIAGAIIGVMILRTIRNVIFFASVPTWSQTLVNALIIIAALAGPGLIALVRRVVKK